MKKIMFNDRYGLTQAVLEGRKTMTRRIIPLCENDLNFLKIAERGEWLFSSRTCLDGAYPAYRVDEVVAIAQPYKDAHDLVPDWITINGYTQHWDECAGYSNKQFIRAEYMPHQIRIANIKVERLQDISEEDCLREGVFRYDKPPLHHEADMFAPWAPHVRPYKWDSDNLIYRCTARYAFAYLIDKISGGGTWNCNPWVFAYEFELLK